MVVKSGEREDMEVFCNHKKEEAKRLGLYTFLFHFSALLLFVFIQQACVSVFAINKKKEKRVEYRFG